MSYKDDISIDKNDMQVECARQPMLYFDYSKMHAQALRDRRLAELDLEQVQAEADERARISVECKKTTETEIKRMVALDPAVQESQKSQIDIAYEVNVLAGAVQALSEKTRMLEQLTKQQLAHWQSEPRQPQESKERQEEEGRAQQHAGLKGITRKKNTLKKV